MGLTFAHDNFFHTIRLQFNRSRSDIRNLYAGVTTSPAMRASGASRPTRSIGACRRCRSPRSAAPPGHHAVRNRLVSHDRPQLLGGDDTRIATRSEAEAISDSLRPTACSIATPTAAHVHRDLHGSVALTPAGTGLDFADFLLGLPQAATLQLRRRPPSAYRERTMDRLLPGRLAAEEHLTLNLGVRYQYFAPYTELANRLVTLDANQDFTEAVPVESGGTGPFTGEFPASLVMPDRNNIAPRLGLAWKPSEKWTLRAGYGVKLLASRARICPIAQQLAARSRRSRQRRRCLARPRSHPPCHRLHRGAAARDAEHVRDRPAFRLGYVHIWNVDVQREVSRTLVVGASYTGRAAAISMSSARRIARALSGPIDSRRCRRSSGNHRRAIR